MDKNYLRNDFDTHVMTESVSRSFDFRRPDGSSYYFFNMTWSRGKISISGDIGSMVLQCWPAMSSLESSVHWGHNADLDYLLGKSSAKEEYDGEATARELIRIANREVIEAINGYWIDDYFRDPETKIYSSKKRLVHSGMRQDLQKVRKGELDRDMIEDVLLFEKKEEKKSCSLPHQDNPHRYWSFFDCWNTWVDLWKALEGFGLYHDYSDDELKNITKPSYRRKMREEIESVCYYKDGAISLFRNTSFDEYPLQYNYSFNNYRIVAAFRWACRRLLAEGVVQPEKAAA
ncbi:hypothetical protein ACLEIY_10385 [Acetobacter tropicalis]|uniref:hypothetical protein n=1 Tax=Acetobacter tropicalis TaxID=104102 RepID=UPI003975CF99